VIGQKLGAALGHLGEVAFKDIGGFKMQLASFAMQQALIGRVFD